MLNTESIYIVFRAIRVQCLIQRVYIYMKNKYNMEMCECSVIISTLCSISSSLDAKFEIK